MTPPSGLLAFPLTPFTPQDAFDRDVFARHVEQQLEARCEVGGVSTPSAWFVACGTGEYGSLSIQEYRQVVRTAVEVIGGRAPVYAGAGAGAQVAREFAQAAQECGADGLLLLPPYLVGSTPAGLVEHIRYVASATTLPIVVYRRANAILDPAAAVALLDVPNVIGIKDGIGDIDSVSRMVAAIRTSGHARAATFGFLNGLPTAEVSASAYRAIGVDSYSSAVMSFAPDIAIAYYAALVSGDANACDALLEAFYLPLTRLRDRVPGYAVAVVKAGARLAGLPVGSVRPPLVDPSPEHIERLEQIIGQGRKALRGQSLSTMSVTRR